MKPDYRDAPSPDDEVDEPQDDQPDSREQVVSKDQHGQRLDKVLVTLAPEFSRNHLQGLVEAGHVRVNAQVVTTPSRKLTLGQQVAIDLVPTAQSMAFRAEDVPVPAVFEDEHLIVVNKPAGLVVHPAAGNWSGTLLNGLLAHHAGAALLPRAGIVHRLDKDTSGLMVVAKTLLAATALVRAIAAREVHREYITLVHGDFPSRVTHVDVPVGRDPKSRIRMAAIPSGKPARTDVEKLASIHDAGGVSALRCVLHTGRTHQIRVHLSSLGHPLVGDLLYGGKALLGLQRQALHATALKLVHPSTGEALVFNAEPPSDFAQAWDQVLA
ncbi:MAG: RluA family pseudouridine synthase [Burkholderiales bacterium]